MDTPNTPDPMPLPDVISALARLKCTAMHLQAMQKAELETVRQSAYYRELEADLAEVTRASADLEREARERSLETYIQTGDKHPHPAITIKMMTVINYDLNEATVWARQNLPEAIHLDPRFFEKHVKAVQATQPVPCAVIDHMPQAQIASDLSRWENLTGVDDTHEYDAEIEY